MFFVQACVQQYIWVHPPPPPELMQQQNRSKEFDETDQQQGWLVLSVCAIIPY